MPAHADIGFTDKGVVGTIADFEAGDVSDVAPIRGERHIATHKSAGYRIVGAGGEGYRLAGKRGIDTVSLVKNAVNTDAQPCVQHSVW